MIERNVPIPTAKGGRGAQRYLFRALTVGDSVLHPCTTTEDKTKALKAAYRCAQYHNWTIVSRRLSEGVRIWRMK